MRLLTLLLLTFFTLNVFGQTDAPKPVAMKTPIGATKQFQSFIKKEKFMPSTDPKYAGLNKDELRWKASKKIDEMGQDFMKISGLEEPNDIKYNVAIMNGLGRFNEIKPQLSKKDRIRICQYIIELMDIINLPSSKGQLNMFAYGFDPDTMKAKKK